VASSGYKYKGWEGLSELDCGVAFRLNLFFGFLNCKVVFGLRGGWVAFWVRLKWEMVS
jgi:hypothetical protein